MLPLKKRLATPPKPGSGAQAWSVIEQQLESNTLRGSIFDQLALRLLNAYLEDSNLPLATSQPVLDPQTHNYIGKIDAYLPRGVEQLNEPAAALITRYARPVSMDRRLSELSSYRDKTKPPFKHVLVIVGKTLSNDEKRRIEQVVGDSVEVTIWDGTKLKELATLFPEALSETTSPKGGTREQALEELKLSDPADVQGNVASQIKLLDSYYGSVLAQANRSFWAALAVATVGVLFFLYGVISLLNSNGGSQAAGLVSVVSGAVVQVIAGLNFYMYNRTSNQLLVYHSRLYSLQHFMLANNFSEGLPDHDRAASRSLVIKALISMPPTIYLHSIGTNTGEHANGKVDDGTRRRSSMKTSSNANSDRGDEPRKPTEIQL